MYLHIEPHTGKQKKNFEMHTRSLKCDFYYVLDPNILWYDIFQLIKKLMAKDDWMCKSNKDSMFDD